MGQAESRVARRERRQWRERLREKWREHTDGEVAKNVEMNGYVGGETVSGFNILIIRASNFSDEVGKTGEEIAYGM
jgi:hypothetical protein